MYQWKIFHCSSLIEEKEKGVTIQWEQNTRDRWVEEEEKREETRIREYLYPILN